MAINKDEKIKQLELEVARLKGVIEGMHKVNPMPYPVPYYPKPYPYNPMWYQTYCASPTTATATTIGYNAATGVN